MQQNCPRVFKNINTQVHRVFLKPRTLQTKHQQNLSGTVASIPTFWDIPKCYWNLELDTIPTILMVMLPLARHHDILKSPTSQVTSTCECYIYIYAPKLLHKYSLWTIGNLFRSIKKYNAMHSMLTWCTNVYSHGPWLIWKICTRSSHHLTIHPRGAAPRAPPCLSQRSPWGDLSGLGELRVTIYKPSNGEFHIKGHVSCCCFHPKKKLSDHMWTVNNLKDMRSGRCPILYLLKRYVRIFIDPKSPKISNCWEAGADKMKLSPGTRCNWLVNKILNISILFLARILVFMTLNSDNWYL